MHYHSSDYTAVVFINCCNFTRSRRMDSIASLPIFTTMYVVVKLYGYKKYIEKLIVYKDFIKLTILEASHVDFTFSIPWVNFNGITL